MIETQASRVRKEPLKTMNMEDIKIEFVDVCVVPTTEAYSIFDFDSDSTSGSPSTPMEVNVSADSPVGSSSSLPSSELTAKPRKRAKLDHMSAEEKAQHRKLMNRISAQSARDRQKALMVRQDSTIKTLQSSSDELRTKNQELTTANEVLSNENKLLKDENKRLIAQVMELEAKLKAANAVIATREEKRLENDQGIVQLKVENDVGNCRGSPSEPAVLRTVPLQKGSSEPLQTLYLVLALWMSCLGLSSQQKPFKMLDRLQKQICFESNSCQTSALNSAVAETIAAQMADQTRTARAGQIEAGLVVQNYLRRHPKHGSHQTYLSSRNTKLASLLSSPTLSRANGTSNASLLRSPLTTMLSLPLKEPATLKLPKFDFGPSHKHDGAISHVPIPTSSPPDALSIFKQPALLLHEEDNNKYFHEADLYDSWKSPTGPLDVELFPELF